MLILSLLSPFHSVWNMNEWDVAAAPDKPSHLNLPHRESPSQTSPEAHLLGD